METTDCENCGEEIEYEISPRTPWDENRKPQVCSSCSDNELGEALAQTETPEGGWPRNSDIDRL